jgi:hypothetical protein
MAAAMRLDFIHIIIVVKEDRGSGLSVISVSPSLRHFSLSVISLSPSFFRPFSVSLLQRSRRFAFLNEKP